MEDTELRQKFDALEKRIGDVYASAEKTRKYFLTLLVVTVIVFVLPLLGLVFAIPSFISTYSEITNI